MAAIHRFSHYPSLLLFISPSSSSSSSFPICYATRNLKALPSASCFVAFFLPTRILLEPLAATVGADMARRLDHRASVGADMAGRLDLKPQSGVLGLSLRAAHCCHACVGVFLLLTLLPLLYHGAMAIYDPSSTIASAGHRGHPMQEALKVQASSEAARPNEPATTLPLPALKLKYTGNSSEKPSGDGVLLERGFLGFQSSDLFRKRGLENGETHGLGFEVILMLVVVATICTGIAGAIAFQHAVILGAVSYGVVSTYLGKRVSTKTAFKVGLRSGIIRLVWLAILHGMVIGFQSLFLKNLLEGTSYLQQVESFIQGFSLPALFENKDAVSGRMALRIGTFWVIHFFIDAVAYAMYITACWVSIMEPEKTGLSLLQRSWELVKSMEMEVFSIKLLETILCSTSCCRVLQKSLGSFLAAFSHSGLQIYFCFVWMVMYLSARSRYEGSCRFTYEILEHFLEKHK